MKSKSVLWGWAGNLLMIGGSFLFCVVVAELVLRMFYPQILESHPRSLYSSDPELGFVLTPNQSGVFHEPEFQFTFFTNSLGLRGAELTSKGQHEYRILVLGDSFTWGEGVMENQDYPTQVERELENRGIRQVRVINGGVPGYSTKQERIWLERIVDKVEADAVLLGFFLGNDFMDNLADQYPTVIDGFLVSSREEGHRRNLAQKLGIPPQLKIALRTNFHLYPFLTKAWVSLLVFTGLENTAEHFEMARNTYSPKGELALVVTRKAIKELSAYCRKKGLPFGIVMIPDVRGNNMMAGREGYDASKPAKVMRELAQSLGIPILDLSPLYHGQTEVFYPIDGHWNFKGHQIAGKAIATSLLDGELVSLLDKAKGISPRLAGES